MSHRLDCPDRYTARREAHFDAEHGGYNRHRYRDECPEANAEYERAFRSEQYRLEEEAEERQREARAAERRRERDAEEYAAYEREREEMRLREEEECAIAEMQEMDDGRVNLDAEPLP